MSVGSFGSLTMDLLMQDRSFMVSSRRVEGVMRRLQMRAAAVGNSVRNMLFIGGGILAAAIRESARFETQLARVASTMEDGQKFTGIFRAGIERLSAEFGLSTKELSDGLYDIVSAGAAPADALEILRISAMAARGGFADLKTTTQGLTAMMNSFQVPASQMIHVSDKIAQAVLMGKLEFEDLAAVLGRVAPISYQANVSMDNMLATLSTLTNTGASASEASTQFINILSQIIKPGKEAAEAAKALGIEMNTAAIEGGSLVPLLEKLKGLTVEQRGKIFRDLRGFKGVESLITQLEVLKKAQEKMATKSAGRTLANWGLASQTTAVQLDRLWSSTKLLAITLGDMFIPMLRGAVDWLIKVYPAVKAWLTVHGPLIAKISATTLAVLALVLVGGKLVTSITAISQALMFMLTNPLLLIPAALVAFAGYMVWSGAKGETAAEKLADAWQHLKFTFEDFALSAEAALIRVMARMIEFVQLSAKVSPAQLLMNFDVVDTDRMLADADKIDEKRSELAKQQEKADNEAGKRELAAKIQMKKDAEALKKLTGINFQKGGAAGGGLTIPVKIKPSFIGAGEEIWKTIQKGIFEAADPTEANTTATDDNTGAVKENTDAIKDLGSTLEDLQSGAIMGP